MTYKENITAILECYFTGFKKEIIDSACNRILEQEPCGDAISRQAVLEIFGYVVDYWKEHAIDVEPHEIEGAIIEQYEFTAKKLSELPLVNPQLKTGHWIIYKDCEGKTRQCTCDQCGYKTGKYTWHNPNFCANCGRRMYEPQKSENCN